MSNIIDRRKNGKNKSSGNRQKFLKRVKGQIKEAVKKKIQDGSIKDADSGGNVKINRKSVKEPKFNHGKAGKRKGVHPGNKEYHKGDTVRKPEGGGGAGGRKGSPDGEGEDDFEFTISREEFLEIFFEELELPRMVKTNLIQVDQFKWKRAGYTKSGVPAKMNIVRSVKQGIARQMALTGADEEELEKLKKELEKLEKAFHAEDQKEEILSRIIELKKRIIELQDDIDSVPFLDDIDLRYNLHVKEPSPATSAVMFCLMDISGSMGEFEKDLAKRFFILLHLFLVKNYDNVDVVFIRHHHEAKEVDEETFFHDKESGGTVVSEALRLMNQIIKERYSTSDWNIYAAQASDGDNWGDDKETCEGILIDDILPYVQYFAYIEVGHDPNSMWFYGDEDDPDTELWTTYERVAPSYENMVMKRVAGPRDIYPVFQELFRKKGLDDEKA